MAGLKLRRLLRPRKPLRAALDALVQLQQIEFWIEDAGGKCLMGEGEPDGQGHDIVFEDAVVGKVYAGRGAAEIVALIQPFLGLEGEKRDLAAEVLDRYRELNLLYEMAERLTECQDIDSIGALVLEEAHKVAPSDIGRVLLLEEGVLTTASQMGSSEEIGGQELIARVYESGRSEMIDDLGVDQSIRSWIAAPIKSRSGVMGLLILGCHRPQAYTSGTLKLATSLAGQVAPAIESARLTEAQRALAVSFARFVPDEFLGALKHSSVTDIDIGEHAQKKMSVLFSDIRAFTTMVEGKTPEENYMFINEYLSRLEPAIRDRDGFVAEVIGDAIMALFDDGGADDAVGAAIACQNALSVYNVFRAEKGEPPVLSGFGVSSGQIMLGTMGSPERIKCGVIGDAVNTASRVEGLTKFYGTGILITNHTHGELKDPSVYKMRPVDRVRAKGKTQAITVYEIMDALPDAVLAQRMRTQEAYLKGWKLYQSGQPSEALVAFANALNTDTTDRVSRLFLGRCWSLLEHGIPENWDGVSDMLVK